MILAMLLAAALTVADRVDTVASQSKLAGVVLIAKGDTVLVEKGYGTVRPAGTTRHSPEARWRLASITKQVTATLIVRDLARWPSSLDAPLAKLHGQDALGTLSMRQVLTHHSGLANPDDSPAGPSGVPSFYLRPAPDLGYCFEKAPTPGAAFAYNNCDYLVAALGLIGSNAKRFPWPAGMTMAKAGQVGVPGFVGGKPEPHYELASFGTAGGLIGTPRSVFDFDRALMTGRLLNPAQRDELWKPEGTGSYQALGQWVFPGKLKGCASPKRIVQRDGEIGGVQTRNYILPDDNLIVIVFTNRSSSDFTIGEVWEGKGFAYDLLSAAACA